MKVSKVNPVPKEREWYKISNPGEVSSPALLVYPARIEENIRRMISIAGGPDRLRPHVKTHKMSEVVRLQMKLGISRFKCATIAEAEMVAECGAGDILLAYQPVGPNISRIFALKKKYHEARISCLADCEETVVQLSEAAKVEKTRINLYLDINNGMNRTGIKPGEKAAELARMIAGMPNIRLEGLHVYDGHIHEKDFHLRKELCNKAFQHVRSLTSVIRKFYSKPLNIVAGGTPTFPVHASYHEAETSPGTLLLWDYGYSSSYSDLDFLHAAVLLMRVVSKPSEGLICIDLGHKAVAAEMPHPRVKMLGMKDYDFVSQNEEHMVLRSPEADKLKVGDVLYGIPYHICPTVDRYNFVSAVNDGRVTGEWKVEARTRRITI
ncbi:MAG: D-TA family PLP-dependent enzyme [Bacteroidota bacterium]|nr:D-TA family PLP-dependent enzyme [Bacteroidota bacterium]